MEICLDKTAVVSCPFSVEVGEVLLVMSLLRGMDRPLLLVHWVRLPGMISLKVEQRNCRRNAPENLAPADLVWTHRFPDRSVSETVYSTTFDSKTPVPTPMLPRFILPWSLRS